MPFISIRLFEKIPQNANFWLDWLPVIISLVGLFGGLFGALYLYKRHQRHQLLINSKYEAFKKFIENAEMLSSSLISIHSTMVVPPLIRIEATLDGLNTGLNDQSASSIWSDYVTEMMNKTQDLNNAFVSYFRQFEIWEPLIKGLNKAKKDIFEEFNKINLTLAIYKGKIVFYEIHKLKEWKKAFEEELRHLANNIFYYNCYVEDMRKLLMFELMRDIYGIKEIELRATNDANFKVLSKAGLIVNLKKENRI